LKKIKYSLLTRLLKDIPKTNFIKMKLYYIYNSSKDDKTAFFDKLKHLEILDKIPHNLLKRSNKYILVFNDTTQIDIEEILLKLNNKELCKLFSLSLNELMDMIDETAKAYKNTDIYIFLRKQILNSFFYTQRELLETLILSIVDNDRYRFAICFMNISRTKRLLGFSFNHETAIREILNNCNKDDFEEILLRLTREELDNIYRELQQTSGGGRMRIKKVIRKY
jgi:hypothetical protein